MASVEEGAEGTISHILRAAFREYFAEEDHFKAQLARKAATAAGISFGCCRSCMGDLSRPRSQTPSRHWYDG